MNRITFTRYNISVNAESFTKCKRHVMSILTGRLNIANNGIWHWDWPKIVGLVNDFKPRWGLRLSNTSSYSSSKAAVFNLSTCLYITKWPLGENPNISLQLCPNISLQFAKPMPTDCSDLFQIYKVVYRIASSSALKFPQIRWILNRSDISLGELPLLMNVFNLKIQNSGILWQPEYLTHLH